MIPSSALLDELLRVSNEVNRSDSLHAVLNTTCEATVKALEIDHSALMLFDEARQQGTVLAEYPSTFGALNTIVSLREPIEQRLLNNLDPVHIEDTSDPIYESELGSLLNVFRAFKIRSILIVPIVCKGRAVGSFSLDNVAGARRFTDDEVRVCKLFAAEIAAAIDHHVWTRRTLELRDAALALSGTRSPTNIFDIVVRHAVRLLEGTSGGFYQWNQVTTELCLVAEPWRPKLIGTTLRLGEGLAGALMAGQNKTKIELNYPSSANLAPPFQADCPFQSVIEVRLEASNGRPFGVLYVDDRAGRLFTDADVRLIELFADHAAASLESVESEEASRSNLARLEFFDQASEALLSGRTLREGCETLSGYLVTRLSALFCRIIAIKKEKPLVLGVKTNRELRSSFERDLRTLAQGNPLFAVHRLLSLKTPFALVEGQDARSFFPHAAVSKLDRVILVALRNAESILGLIELGFAQGGGITGLSLDVVGFDLSQKLGPLFLTSIEREEGIRQHEKLVVVLNGCRSVSDAYRARNTGSEVLRTALELAKGRAGILFKWRSEGERLLCLEGLGTAQREGSSVILLESARRGQAVSGPPDAEVPQWVSCSLAVPLKLDGAVTHVLWLWLDDESPIPDNTDLAFLSLYGEFAAAALLAGDRSRNHRIEGLWRVVARVSTFLLEAKLEQKILHAVLTFVTARYGLRFNRSAIFLLNDSISQAIGSAGIGDLEKSSAERSWRDWERSDQTTIDGYLRWLASDMPQESGIGRGIRALPVAVSREARDPFSQAVFGSPPEPVQNPNDSHLKIDQEFLHAFQPASPLFILPMRATNRVIGVLVADNRFIPSSVSAEERDLLQLVANMAAHAINRLRNERIHVALLGSPSLYSITDPLEILQASLNGICRHERAVAATLFVIEEQSLIATVSTDKSNFRLRGPLDETCWTARVINARQPHVATSQQTADEFGLAPDGRNPACSLALPVYAEETPIATLWIHYSEQQQFDEARIQHLQTMADNAGVAYLVKLSWKLEGALALAAEKLLGEIRPTEVVREVVNSARRTFGADLATLWTYSKSTDSFLLEEFGASGWPLEKEPATPQFGRTTYNLLVSNGYRAESDTGVLVSEWPPGPGETTIASLGFSSFQGVAVTENGELLGVLYLTYRNRRVFTARDEQHLRRFAGVASLALRRAKLTEQAARFRNAAKMFAELSASQDLGGTLTDVARGIQYALDARSVVIYSYNPERLDFDYPPGLSAGVLNPLLAQTAANLPSRSIVRLLIKRNEPYVAPDTEKDDLFRDRRFTREENVRACLAIPLQLSPGEEKVGLMFVNYSGLRQFSTVEIEDAKLLAKQAASICRHMQMKTESQTLARHQSALVDLAHSLLVVRTLDAAFKSCLDIAASELNVEFADIVLPRDGELVFVKGLGWPGSFDGNHILEPGAKSHAGFTINENEPVRVDDFALEGRFSVPKEIRDNRIVSGLGVPMRFGSEVVGAMLVHTRDQRHFTNSETVFLSATASQAAVATRLFEPRVRQAGA